MEIQISEKNKLLNSVLQGRLDFLRSCAIHSSLPGADFQSPSKKSTYYSSGMDYAPCNGVLEGLENNSLSDYEIQQAIDFFNQRKIPFIWWTAEKKLENKGFQFGGILTGISLDISKSIPTESSSSLQIKVKKAHSDTDLRTFSELTINGFGMNQNVLEQFQSICTTTMHAREHFHFLAYINETPVGTATLSSNPSSAGIWNLTTLPQFRKHGIGAALVHAAIVEAHKHNHKEVMAILMPKGMAWGLFTKLGFQEVCQFPFYVYGTSAETLEK